MKDYVLELIDSKEGYNSKLNVLREYLQAYVLRILYEIKFSRNVVFLGGTALRFLYNLPRFSEDLDFSLLTKEKYTFIDTVKKIEQELILAGYNISIAYKDEKTIQYAMIKFRDLMFDAKLSPHKEQIFSIKIEVDINPPKRAKIDTKVINIYFPLSFFTYDLSSLFAGKLHAIFSRKYSKGRDFYDLGWFLSKWKSIVPNIEFLNNALKQTGWIGDYPTKSNWRQLLYNTIEKVEWHKVKKDVERFLERPSDLGIFNKENILKMIQERNE